MKSLEIEVKVPLKRTDDRKEQEAVARSMMELLDMSGWSYDTTQTHRDLYLSHPLRDFSQTDEALRIRTVKDMEDGRTDSFLTYKGPRLSKESKARLEKELRIPSARDMREIFYELGFGKVLVIEKERSIFRLDDVEASVDTLPELGCFLELEVIGDDIDNAEGRIETILEDLDLRESERLSYLEMLLQKLV